MAAERRCSSSADAATRVNSPAQSISGDSLYHDATRINSVDLEGAAAEDAKQASSEGQKGDTLKLEGVENPLHWSSGKRWAISLLMGSVYLNCTLASSMATGATEEYQTRFGASPLVSALILSLYLLGFALGPIFWGPFSEVYGRKMTLMVALPAFLLFNIGCALSNNMATLLVLRFFAGLFGASPQSNAGATISDMWSPRDRLWPMFVYTIAAFLGPILGPLTGGFLFVSGHWRFIYYTLAIFAGVNIILIAVVQEESYAPLLLKRKATKLRSQGHTLVWAPVERQQASVYDMLRVHASRPLVMLVTELPLAYAALWTSFTYAIIFVFLEAYPVIFGGIYGMNAGEEGLCFLGLGVGIAATTPIVWYFNNLSIKTAVKAGGAPVPESRLQQVMLSAPLFVVGFFWFGWTARPDIHWIVPVLGSIPIGASFILAFNALNVYAAQCYPVYAASALGAMAFSRCFLAVFVPLFARQMYEALGPGWASSVLGFISLAAVPIPIIFYRWGPSIRTKSTMAVKA